MSSYFDYKSYAKDNYHAESIFLGYFFEWDPQKTYKISKKFGFKAENSARTGYYKFADIDDYFISIHHWMKWYKFGFTRLFDNLSLEIRNKRISKNKALKIIKADGLKAPMNDINKFCKYCNISKKKSFLILQKILEIKIFGKKEKNIL